MTIVVLVGVCVPSYNARETFVGEIIRLVGSPLVHKVLLLTGWLSKIVWLLVGFT